MPVDSLRQAAAEGSEPIVTGSFRPINPDGLPLFRQDCDGYATFYAPGCLCVVGLSGAEQFQSTIAPAGERRGDPNAGWGAKLWREARSAVAQAERLVHEPFKPECLTLYLHNECNLNCLYCYADPAPGPAARLEPEVIVAAAQVVAANCRARDIPFTVAFHGGGEPSLHRRQVESALGLIAAAASQHGVDVFRYVATNGVLSEEKAAWLARSFDLVGLSCDGPAGIHDLQRPFRDGRPTLHLLERTAHILEDAGTPFQVRATITAASLHQQAEIAGYLCQEIRPQTIRFEPVYLGGRQGEADDLNPQHATEFVDQFLQARAVARQYGIPLTISGSRPDSVHGPYCNVFRQVINLVPGGVATACFKAVDADQVRRRGACTGSLDPTTGRFEIEHDHIQTLRHRLAVLPPACNDCFNRYHCVRGCPDLCPLEDDLDMLAAGAGLPGFRCLYQKSLAAALLAERARHLWAEILAGEAEEPHGTRLF